MDVFEAIALAVMQGLTEFLPISSSAHLILAPRFFGWKDQGLAFDVAVHLGTLLAVVAYFRRELLVIAGAWTSAMLGRDHDQTNAHLGWAIIIASPPALAAGLLLADIIENQLRSPLIIALTTAVFGVVLWLADGRNGARTSEDRMTLKTAALIGCAQAFALVPGTSRSGITMTAGLALGLTREAASRFSFLLAIPTILGASVFKLWDLLQAPSSVPWDALIIGLIVAAASAYLCIKLFLQAIGRIGMLPFMVYRVLLAAVILVILV